MKDTTKEGYAVEANNNKENGTMKNVKNMKERMYFEGMWTEQQVWELMRRYSPEPVESRLEGKVVWAYPEQQFQPCEGTSKTIVLKDGVLPRVARYQPGWGTVFVDVELKDVQEIILSLSEPPPEDHHQNFFGWVKMTRRSSAWWRIEASFNMPLKFADENGYEARLLRDFLKLEGIIED